MLYKALLLCAGLTMLTSCAGPNPEEEAADAGMTPLATVPPPDATAHVSLAPTRGHTAAGVLTVAAVAAAGGAGLLLALGLAPAGLAVKLLIALAAAATALALGLKAVTVSLYPSGDLARLGWFNAAATQARSQFDHGDLDARIDALRAMEALAYRELRDFIADHARGR